MNDVDVYFLYYCDVTKRGNHGCVGIITDVSYADERNTNQWWLNGE